MPIYDFPLGNDLLHFNFGNIIVVILYSEIKISNVFEFFFSGLEEKGYY